MRRAFPRNFFKSRSSDPFLIEDTGAFADTAVETADATPPGGKVTPLGRFAERAEAEPSLLSPDDAFERPPAPARRTDAGDGLPDYVINSIFSPEAEAQANATPDAAAPLPAPQQVFFVREQEAALQGLREINNLLRKGWRVANVFPGPGTGYSAVVVLERPSL